MDVQVPLAITEGLRRRGVDVVTAQEDGSGLLEDPELLDRATVLGRLLFTQDEDFLSEGAVACVLENHLAASSTLTKCE